MSESDGLLALLGEIEARYETAMRERGDHDLLDAIRRYRAGSADGLPPVDWRELYRRAIAWKSALLETYDLDEDALPSTLIDAIERCYRDSRGAAP